MGAHRPNALGWAAGFVGRKRQREGSNVHGPMSGRSYSCLISEAEVVPRNHEKANKVHMLHFHIERREADHILRATDFD